MSLILQCTVHDVIVKQTKFEPELKSAKRRDEKNIYEGSQMNGNQSKMKSKHAKYNSIKHRGASKKHTILSQVNNHL